MRIQHNIMAMNAFRNYNTNTSALGRNLEKLSSGYKINRAGDDAAGLAISEKMRAQISGLKQAQSNVKDGISLVKTAEGALQEVQDMLNRMTTLATQSANGTYDKDVDRANLQKEVEALATEIDRIADASNFNGTKLLNGDLAGPSIESTKGAAQEAAVAAVYDSGTLTASSSAVGSIVAGGHTFAVDGTQASSDTLAEQLALFVADYNANATGMNDWTAAVNDAGDGIKFTAKTAGAIGSTGAPAAAPNGATVVTAGKDQVAATGAKTEVDFTDLTGEKVIGGTIKLGGTEFKVVETGKGSGTNGAVGTNEIAVNRTDNAAAIATALSAATLTGHTLSVNGNKLVITNDTTGVASVAPTVTTANMGGLRLQIGDTADSYNQLTVTVGDMHTSALGVDVASINVKDQASAADAIKKIKDAINTVSSTRGDLGAIQNRLEHTTNNLAIMTENIQDAESTIRDVDIADEMTTYTKNNILLQSAQAMLAQANQMPQGVLQLLQ